MPIDVRTLQLMALAGRIPAFLLGAVVMAWLWQHRRGRSERLLVVSWSLMTVAAVGGTVAVALVDRDDVLLLRTFIAACYLSAQFASLPFLAAGMVGLAHGRTPAPAWTTSGRILSAAGVLALVGVGVVLATSLPGVDRALRTSWRVGSLTLVQAVTFLGVALLVWARRERLSRLSTVLVVGSLLLLAAHEVGNLSLLSGPVTGYVRLAVYSGEMAAWLAVALGAVVLVMDMDRRAAARLKQALEVSNRRVQRWMDGGHDIVWMIDPTGRVRFASPSMTRALGWDADKVLERDALLFVHPDDRESFRAAHAQVLAQAEVPIRTTLRWARADGGWLFLESLHTAGELNDASPAVQLVSRDITERQRAEGLRAEALRLKTIRRLAGGVAHDFNGILTAVMVGAEVMRATPTLDGEATAALDDMEGAAARGAGLTRQLLAFADERAPERETFFVAPRLDAMKGALQAVIGTQHQLALSLSAGRTLAVAIAPVLFEQMMLALAEEAARGLVASGLVAIELSERGRTVAGPTGVEHPRSFGRIRIRAIGTSRARAAGRPTDELRPEAPSAGLSLVVSQQIVEQEGGVIDLRSEGDTVADVFLPLVAQPEGAVAV